MLAVTGGAVEAVRVWRRQQSRFSTAVRIGLSLGSIAWAATYGLFGVVQLVKFWIGVD
ncbi:hypothetical protein [Tsukamurella pseudospumae]|nr:hypothetical protein [Tsukamurella pseudospumae]